jgi:hypothetical protein
MLRRHHKYILLFSLGFAHIFFAHPTNFLLILLQQVRATPTLDMLGLPTRHHPNARLTPPHTANIYSLAFFFRQNSYTKHHGVSKYIPIHTASLTFSFHGGFAHP